MTDLLAMDAVKGARPVLRGRGTAILPSYLSEVIIGDLAKYSA